MSILKMSDFIRLEEQKTEIVDALFGEGDESLKDLDHTARYVESLLEEDPTGFDIGLAVAVVERADREFKGGSELFERIVKRVSVTSQRAGGKLVTRMKDRETRARRATQTTGLSKSKRNRAARKAAKTIKRDKAGQRRANKKRKKSMKRRDQMGL